MKSACLDLAIVLDTSEVLSEAAGYAERGGNLELVFNEKSDSVQNYKGVWSSYKMSMHYRLIFSLGALKKWAFNIFFKKYSG